MKISLELVRVLVGIVALLALASIVPEELSHGELSHAILGHVFALVSSNESTGDRVQSERTIHACLVPPGRWYCPAGVIAKSLQIATEDEMYDG